MIIEVVYIFETVLKREDIKQLIGPEIRLIIPDKEWNLLRDQDDPDGGEHPFYHGGRNKMGEAAKPEDSNQCLQETGYCNG